MNKEPKRGVASRSGPETERALGDDFCRLAGIVARLRKECPWDRRQTPQSLLKGLLEETYEVIETIEDEDWDALREELGDLLLQVLLQAEIQREAGCFDLGQVIRQLAEKMVRRHPHVFENRSVVDHETAAHDWEQIKNEEKGGTSSLFDGWTRGLPALLDSYKIGRKAGSVGFDWPDPLQVLDKIEEEIGEIRQALLEGERAPLREELGDLLFAVSNLVRKFGFEPEETLRIGNRKFTNRFREMERLAEKSGQALKDLDLEEQEELWQRVKAMLAARGVE